MGQGVVVRRVAGIGFFGVTGDPEVRPACVLRERTLLPFVDRAKLEEFLVRDNAWTLIVSLDGKDVVTVSGG